MSAPDLYYFAYGSNLNADDWAWYCQEQGSHPGVLEAVGTAVLPDMQLCFDYHSPSRNGGALNIRPALGHIVHGVLFRASAEGWDLLDRKEGAPLFYDRVLRTALLPDGSSLTVITYEVTEPMRRDFCRPTQLYREIVSQGLEDWDLPLHALHQAADNQPQQVEIDCVFVYGTLMFGQHNARLIDINNVRLRHRARTSGILHSTDYDFPAMRLGNAAAGVKGECLEIEDPCQQLVSLDFLEGFRGYDQPSLYHRTLVDVHCEDGETRRAWCYVAAKDDLVQDVIDSGCWRTYQFSRPVRL